MSYCEGQTDSYWSRSGDGSGFGELGITNSSQLRFKVQDVNRGYIDTISPYDYRNVPGFINAPYYPPRIDTLIPTPDTTLRKLLIAGEERNNLKKQVRNLEEQVKLLSEVIKEHEGKDEVQEQAYKNQMDNLKQQLEICKEQVKAFEKMVRAERRKRRAITIGGILTTGAAILLSIKK
jgi:hypothetical protein